MLREIYTRLIAIDTLSKPLVVIFKDVHEISSIFLAGFGEKNNASVYITWVMVRSLMLVLIPSIFLHFNSLARSLERTSYPRMKR